MEEEKVQTIETLVSKLSSVSEQTRTESLSDLRLLSKYDPETRPIITSAGAIPYISECLYSPSSIFQENAAATLLNLSIYNRHQIMATDGLLDALSHALRNPTSAAAGQAAAALVYSLVTVDEYKLVVGSKRDILYALVDMLRNPNSHARTIKDAVKALFGVCLCQLNRMSVIELGAVPVLFSLVMKDGRIGIVEDSTAVIAQIAGCEEAWEAFTRVGGVGVLVDLLDWSTGSSDRIKENAVSGLLNLVEYGNEEVAESLRSMGARLFDGVVEVAENGSVKGKSKAVALLKMIDSRRDRLDSRVQSLLGESP